MKPCKVSGVRSIKKLRLNNRVRVNGTELRFSRYTEVTHDLSHPDGKVFMHPGDVLRFGAKPHVRWLGGGNYDIQLTRPTPVA